MTDCYQKKECRLCESTQLETVVRLTATPPGNHFVAKSGLGSPQTCYPLGLNFCHECYHVQLSHVVDPKILYQKNYSYVSAISPIFVEHLGNHAAQVVKKYGLSSSSLVIDIGSNDGTNLRGFQKWGCRVLGIDPATEIVALANQGGIETLCEFFNFETSKKYREKYGLARVITSHNACAHIDDLKSVVEGVRHWLAEDGIFIMEVGYLLDVYQNIWFDTIYHEHLDYHSVAPLVQFFKKLQMEVINVERVNSQGGSIRLTVQKQGGPHRGNSSVQALVQLEEDKGLNRAETFKTFGARINAAKDSLKNILWELKQAGKSIAGYGAPTKATTLMTHFGLDGKVIDFIVEDNKLKQGMFTPLHHIPVLSPEAILEKKPDYLLLLAWNFAESLIAKCAQYKSAGGRFIVPLPHARMVE